MTMGRTWAYNPQETDWKAPGQLVRNLVEVVSRGGNYLLNVGPTPQGVFPPEAVERLQYIGQWMERNHEAIHGTTYTTLQPPLEGARWGQATRKGDRVYLHIWDWPPGCRLEIDGYPAQVRDVGLMTGEPLAFTQSGRRLEVSLPSQRPDPDVSVIVVTNDGEEEGWSECSAAVGTTTSPRR